MQEDKNVLWATIGLPRSGKSSWAKTQAHRYPIVSPDAIRLALNGERFTPQLEPYVWSIAKTMVVSLFNAGNKTVVLDSTNVTAKSRQYWNDPSWDILWFKIQCPLDICLRRAHETNQFDLGPVIQRMSDNYDIAGIDIHQTIKSYA